MNGPGEIKGAPRAWDRGTNFRPDLVGDHPAGSADDFAGLSPLPAVQPPLPSCTAGPGLSLPLELRASVFRAYGKLADPGFVLQLRADNLLANLCAWYRGEDFAALPDDTAVSGWTDSTGNGHDLFTTIPFTYKTSDPDRGFPAVAFSSSAFPIHVEARMDSILPLTRKCFNVYFAAYTFRFGTNGATVAGPGHSPTLGYFEYDTSNWVCQDTHETIGGGFHLSTAIWHVFSVRKTADALRVSLDGLPIGGAPASRGSLAGMNGLAATRNRLGLSYTAIAEVLVYCGDVDDDQDAAIIAYLQAKYHAPVNNPPLASHGGADGAGSSMMAGGSTTTMSSGGGAKGGGSSSFVWTGTMSSGGGAKGGGSSSFVISGAISSAGGALGGGESTMG